MEPFAAETEESTEDLTGRRKFRLKSLKSRLFGRTKRGDGEGDPNLSQSTSDITAAKGGSEENLVCPLASRALSHESIFLADDEAMPDSGSTAVLSQENVHGKIKALQTKLQQQKMHLGPPPLFLPIRRPEDLGGSSEDVGPSRSPPEMSGGDGTFQGASYKATSQPSSQPIPRPPPTRAMPPAPSVSAPLSALSPDAPPTTLTQSLDFSTPAQFTPCLDTSAARHRMAVKPRKQRVSTKGKRLTGTSLETLNNIDHPVSEVEEGQEVTVAEEITHSQSHSKRSPELIAPVTSTPSEPQETPKSSGLTLSHGTTRQDQTLPGAALTARLASQVQASPQIPSDAIPSQQPQSPPVQPDVKERSSGVLEILAMSLSKMDTRLNKTGETDKNPDIKPRLTEESVLPSTLASVVAFRTSSLRGNPEEGSSSQTKTDIRNTGVSLRQAPGQAEKVSTRGSQRPASASFSSSVTAAKVQDGERPRSGSFLGVVEQAGAKLKREGGAEVNLPPSKTSQRGQELKTDRPEEDKPKPLEPKGGPAAGAVRGQEVEDALEAKEDQEDGGKTAFGVKLRSTTLSLKVQSDASAVYSESKVKRLSVEMGSQPLPLAPLNPASKPTNTSCNPATSGPLRQTDGALNQPGPSTLPVKPNPPTAENAHVPVLPAEAQTISSSPKEAESAVPAPQEPQTASQPAPQTASQPAPQTAPSEVSWMSLAVMKTRSLQQLLTVRLPREFPSMQTAAWPPAQAQPTNQGQSVAQTQTQKVTQSETQNVTQTQTQTAKPQLQKASQPSTDTTKTPVTQTASQPSTDTTKTPVTQTASQPSTDTTKTPVMQTASQPSTDTAKTPVTQTASQPPTDTTKTPVTQTASQPPTDATKTPAQTAKSTLTTMQERIATQPTGQLYISKLPQVQSTKQMSKQVYNPPLQPSTSQPATQSSSSSVSHPATQTSPWATQSPVRSAPQTQTESTSSQQPTPQQPPWRSQCLRSATQPKPTTSVQASDSTCTPSPASALAPGRGEKAANQGKGAGPPVSDRRAVWTGSVTVGERAAFLQKRAERTTTPGSKVEARRSMIEIRPPEESPASARTTRSNTDPAPVGRLGLRHPESSPTKVPGRLAEDKWTRKNTPPSSSPSSTPMTSSPLQSISDGGQPSWMELAKRKSMAWSDKTMD